MNRQQRRQMERELRKQPIHDKIDKPIENLIENAFVDGQKYNNYEWSMRLKRIARIYGIGPKRMDEIFRTLEAPLTPEEKAEAWDCFKREVKQIDVR